VSFLAIETNNSTAQDHSVSPSVAHSTLELKLTVNVLQTDVLKTHIILESIPLINLVKVNNKENVYLAHKVRLLHNLILKTLWLPLAVFNKHAQTTRLPLQTVHARPVDNANSQTSKKHSVFQSNSTVERFSETLALVQAPPQDVFVKHAVVTPFQTKTELLV